MNQIITISGRSLREITPIVTIKNNAVVANSRDVAAYFGKEHRNVIAKIDKLLADLPTPHAYFQAGVYTLPETGSQTHTCFDMTRDGFTLLAMGFTGAKALHFKLRYIDALQSKIGPQACP